MSKKGQQKLVSKPIYIGALGRSSVDVLAFTEQGTGFIGALSESFDKMLMTYCDAGIAFEISEADLMRGRVRLIVDGKRRGFISTIAFGRSAMNASLLVKESMGDVLGRPDADRRAEALFAVCYGKCSGLASGWKYLGDNKEAAVSEIVLEFIAANDSKRPSFLRVKGNELVAFTPSPDEAATVIGAIVEHIEEAHKKKEADKNKK